MKKAPIIVGFLGIAFVFAAGAYLAPPLGDAGALASATGVTFLATATPATTGPVSPTVVFWQERLMPLAKGCTNSAQCRYGRCKNRRCGACSTTGDCKGWGRCKAGQCGSCNSTNDCKGWGGCKHGQCVSSPY